MRVYIYHLGGVGGDFKHFDVLFRLLGRIPILITVRFFKILKWIEGC